MNLELVSKVRWTYYSRKNDFESSVSFYEFIVWLLLKVSVWAKQIYKLKLIKFVPQHSIKVRFINCHLYKVDIIINRNMLGFKFHKRQSFWRCLNAISDWESHLLQRLVLIERILNDPFIKLLIDIICQSSNVFKTHNSPVSNHWDSVNIDSDFFE